MSNVVRLSLARAPWKVEPEKKGEPKRSLLDRLFRRREPTTYQKALAVHLYFAERAGSALK